MPFVQGQLRQESLSIAFRTECAHCARPMRLDIDNELGYRVVGNATDPLLVFPLVDIPKLTDPSIIDAL